MLPYYKNGDDGYYDGDIRSEGEMSISFQNSDLLDFLERESKEIRVHPNGFIQVVLGNRTRVHFWHHKIPRQEVRTPIHDHIWDMKSFVLKGRIVNINHKVQKTANPEYKVYEPNEDGLEYTGSEVEVFDRNFELVGSGSEYSVPAYQFHESIPAEPSVTVIKKSKEKKKKPRVLVSKNEEPDNSFDREEVMQEEEMWNFVEKMVDDEVERNRKEVEKFKYNDFNRIVF